MTILHKKYGTFMENMLIFLKIPLKNIFFGKIPRVEWDPSGNLESKNPTRKPNFGENPTPRVGL